MYVQLRKHMLTLNTYEQYKLTNKPKLNFLPKCENKVLNNDIKLQSYYKIKDKDVLFWYFYIAKYGYDSYKDIEHKFTIEKEIKIKNIELARKKLNILKDIKYNKDDFESNLLNSEIINLMTFKALCVFNNLNVVLIKNKIYYHFNYSDDDEPFILNFIDDSYVNDRCIKMNYIQENMYHITNINKPISGIASYKLQDLIDICNKLDINLKQNNEKNKTKPMLYADIKQYFFE